MRSSVFYLDLGRLGIDKTFPFKAFDIFLERVLAHACGFTNSCIARVALECLSVLAIHQKCIYYDLTCRQVKAEDGFGQREIIAGDISFLLIQINRSRTAFPLTSFVPVPTVCVADRTIL